MKGMLMNMLMRVFMGLLDNSLLKDFKQKAFKELRKRFDDPNSEVDDMIFGVIALLLGIEEDIKPLS